MKNEKKTTNTDTTTTKKSPPQQPRISPRRSPTLTKNVMRMYFTKTEKEAGAESPSDSLEAHLNFPKIVTNKFEIVGRLSPDLVSALYDIRKRVQATYGGAPRVHIDMRRRPIPSSPQPASTIMSRLVTAVAFLA